VNEGWLNGRVSDCVFAIAVGKSVNGGDTPATASEMGVLKTSAVSTGCFRPSENKIIVATETHLASVPVLAGMILIGRSNTKELVGGSALVRDDHPNLFLPDKIWAVRVKEGFDSGWLHAYLSSPRVRGTLRELASGSSAGMKNISMPSLLGLEVRYPPLPEQRKIAEILGAWDDAIEMAGRLRESKQRGYRALSFELVAQSTRDLAPLSKVVKPVSQRNNIYERRVLTSSSQRGLVDQESYFKRRVAGADLANYYLLERGDFAYNRSSSIGSPYGAVRRLNDHASGVVSTLYLCFRISESSKVNPNYLDHLFRSNLLDRQLVSIVSEGARAHGLLNVSKADFLELTIPLPAIDRQSKIASALDSALIEIALIDREIALLREQKRGLMQKLLTGDIRVTVDPTEEAEP
jgi:type I restriction enzyme, S subunit